VIPPRRLSFTLTEDPCRKQARRGKGVGGEGKGFHWPWDIMGKDPAGTWDETTVAFAGCWEAFHELIVFQTSLQFTRIICGR
jgi:hypothetical protein